MKTADRKKACLDQTYPMTRFAPWGRVLRIKAFNTAHGQLWCLHCPGQCSRSWYPWAVEQSSWVSSPATAMSLWWGVEAQLVTLKFGLNLLRTMVTWYRIQLNSPSNYGHVTSQLKGRYGAAIERNQSNCHELRFDWRLCYVTAIIVCIHELLMVPMSCWKHLFLKLGLCSGGGGKGVARLGSGR